MTYAPLNVGNAEADCRSWFRLVVVWFGFLGLFSNFVLPAALSVALGSLDPGRGVIGSSLCSATSNDHPNKSKPSLFVHHCALCTTAAASQLRRRADVRLARELGDITYPPPGTTSAAARWRHGAAKARAPPRIA
jgi:hypothetical protein